MVPYTKPAKSPKDLVNHLKQRGLIIKDEARAERYIQNIGYYRLSAYMFPFLKDPKTSHQYKQNVTFDQVLRINRHSILASKKYSLFNYRVAAVLFAAAVLAFEARPYRIELVHCGFHEFRIIS